MSNLIGFMEFAFDVLDGTSKRFNTTKLSDMNEKILKKGSVKVGGERISLTDETKKSVDDVIISRLDALTNNSKLDGSGDMKIVCKWDSIPAVKHTLYRKMQFCTLDDVFENNPVSINEYFAKSTFVKILSKKHMGAEAKNMDPDNIITNLACTSNLIQIFRSGIWKKWKDVVDAAEENNISYVLYIPNILVYLNNDGRVLATPYHTNLLLIAVPSAKNMKDGIEKTTTEEATKFIVSDTLKAVCYIGSERVFIDPTDYRYLEKNFDDSIEAWKIGCEHDTYKNTVKETCFCIPNETNYLIMKSAF